LFVEISQQNAQNLHLGLSYLSWSNLVKIGKLDHIAVIGTIS